MNSKHFFGILLAAAFAFLLTPATAHAALISITEKPEGDGSINYFFKNLAKNTVKVTYSVTSKYGKKKTTTEVRTVSAKEEIYVINSQISTKPRIISESIVDHK